MNASENITDPRAAARLLSPIMSHDGRRPLDMSASDIIARLLTYIEIADETRQHIIEVAACVDVRGNHELLAGLLLWCARDIGDHDAEAKVRRLFGDAALYMFAKEHLPLDLKSMDDEERRKLRRIVVRLALEVGE